MFQMIIAWTNLNKSKKCLPWEIYPRGVIKQLDLILRIFVWSCVCGHIWRNLDALFAFFIIKFKLWTNCSRVDDVPAGKLHLGQAHLQTLLQIVHLHLSMMIVVIVDLVIMVVVVMVMVRRMQGCSSWPISIFVLKKLIIYKGVTKKLIIWWQESWVFTRVSIWRLSSARAMQSCSRPMCWNFLKYCLKIIPCTPSPS